MSTGRYTVAIIVDPAFGDRLDALAGQFPIWIADTPSNRTAAERRWRTHPARSADTSVTTFRVDPDAGPATWCAGVLGTIVEHHGEYSHDPPVSDLEIVGVALDPALEAALAAYGFPRVEVTPDGFRARAV